MSNRFPLIVNETSKKIEELISGDNLDLSGNGIIINGSLGVAGQYLKSNGSTLVWDNPGNVYLTASQTLENKTFIGSILSGSLNTFSNIPNTALVNSTVTINGSTVALGGSVTVPDNNTTYSISAIDGTTASKKSIRLTAANPSATTDVTLVAGNNVSIGRLGNEITIESSYVDTDTITTLQSAVGGTAVSGAVVLAAGGSSTIAQTGNTITISSSYINTVTRIRGTSSGTYLSGDFTLIEGSAINIIQSGNDITIASSDTITRLKSASLGTFVTGDVIIDAAGAASVSQIGNTITISSTDTNTITSLQASGGSAATGSITIAGGGSTTVTQSGSTITVASVDTDTIYTAAATGGLNLSGQEFSLKNNSNLQASRILKWDDSNNQLTNSIISDDGTTVTIGGDLTVTGTQTILNTSTLVVADNEIELRRGNNLVGSNSGLRVNRVTDGTGNVTSYISLNWFESGNYWSVYDGSVRNRLVTEGETQILNNKTLNSPTLNTPSLGIATATTINGLTISNAPSAILTIDSGKTFRCRHTLTFTGTDGSSVAFGAGGTVTYRGDTLSVFSTTTSAQKRGVMSDETGTGVLVFNNNPSFETGISTSSTSFALVNTTATTVNAFGSATAISFGAATGATTIQHNLEVVGNVTLGNDGADIITINGLVNIDDNDLTLRSTDTYPLRIGRGGNNNQTNTRVGFNALQNNSSGTQSTAFGFSAGEDNSQGQGNTYFGYRAGKDVTIGDINTFVGRDAGQLLVSGDGNVAIGANTLSANQQGSYNVCIGAYAGFAALGSGNVIIGAASNQNAGDVTYSPPLESGDNQLVIGSGANAWIRGNSSFDITIPQNLGVSGNVIITGDLTVNGVYTSVNSSVVTIDDKAIELGSVVNTTFIASALDQSNYISGITPTTGLIAGMVVTSNTTGFAVPAGTFITSITEDNAYLSEVVSTSVSGNSGNVNFSAVGPSDTSADGGGIVLKGTTDKTIVWSNFSDAWTLSEHLNIATGKEYRIGGALALSTSTLGATIVNSSLTSVGTLTGLSVNGAIHLGGRISEKVTNSYVTSLAPVSNILTIDCSSSSVVVGTVTTSAINTWAFTNVNLANGQALTLTLIIDSNTSATYGDACAVDGTSISGGVRWAGGSPPSPSPNEDILTFVIVKDVGGVTRVYASSNTNFS